MYSTIMVNLDPFGDNARLLEIARGLAERFRAGIIGITASQPIQVVYDAGALSGDVVELDRVDVEQALKVAEAQFHAALTQRARHVEWRSKMSMDSPSAYIARQARSADLLLSGVSHNSSVFDNTRVCNTSDLVMQAGRPVLIVPASAKTLVASNIMVGWKDTREARRAIADALPFLRSATTVIIAELMDSEDALADQAGGDDVVAWLRWHGVTARRIQLAAERDQAMQLNALAASESADLIVAGAYGHSRFREWALGGVTAGLLQHADMCTLMSH